MTPVLVINSGSSSFKYQLIDMDSEATLASGLVERIGEGLGAAEHTVYARPEPAAPGEPSGMATFLDAKRTRELPIPDHTAGFRVMLDAFASDGPSLDEHAPIERGVPGRHALVEAQRPRRGHDQEVPARFGQIDFDAVRSPRLHDEANAVALPRRHRPRAPRQAEARRDRPQDVERHAHARTSASRARSATSQRTCRAMRPSEVSSFSDSGAK